MSIKKTRGFEPSATRYKFDFKLGKDFAQLDTCEDASYYGNWASAKRLELFSFAEGDTCHTVCDTPEEFREEVERFVEFYRNAGRKFYGIDPGAHHTPEVLAPWAAAGLLHLIH